MKVLIYIILLIAVLYITSKFLNIFPCNIEISLLGIKIKIQNKEKRPDGGCTPKGRFHKKLK